MSNHNRDVCLIVHVNIILFAFVFFLCFGHLKNDQKDFFKQELDATCGSIITMSLHVTITMIIFVFVSVFVFRSCLFIFNLSCLLSSSFVHVFVFFFCSCLCLCLSSFMSFSSSFMSLSSSFVHVCLFLFFVHVFVFVFCSPGKWSRRDSSDPPERPRASPPTSRPGPRTASRHRGQRDLLTKKCFKILNKFHQLKISVLTNNT